MTTDTNAADALKGYDRVEVPAPGGGRRSLTRKQFETLPLRERVSFLIEGRAQFFLEGRPVSASEAMRRKSTPDPVETTLTVMPVSFLNPSATSLLTVSSLAE